MYLLDGDFVHAFDFLDVPDDEAQLVSRVDVEVDDAGADVVCCLGCERGHRELQFFGDAVYQVADPDVRVGRVYVERYVRPQG